MWRFLLSGACLVLVACGGRSGEAEEECIEGLPRRGVSITQGVWGQILSGGSDVDSASFRCGGDRVGIYDRDPSKDVSATQLKTATTVEKGFFEFQLDLGTYSLCAIGSSTEGLHGTCHDLIISPERPVVGWTGCCRHPGGGWWGFD